MEINITTDWLDVRYGAVKGGYDHVGDVACMQQIFPVMNQRLTKVRLHISNKPGMVTKKFELTSRYQRNGYMDVWSFETRGRVLLPQAFWTPILNKHLNLSAGRLFYIWVETA